MANFDFLVDVVNQRLISDFLSTRAAPSPRFVFGDAPTISVRLLEPNSNNADLPWRQLTQDDQSIRVGLGNPGGDPTDGTFELTFDGDTATGIAFDATADDVETALNLLASVIAAGGVTVAGYSQSGGYRVSFNLVGARTIITADTDALSPSSSAYIVEQTEGDVSTKEIQIIAIETDPAAYVELTDDIAAPAVGITAVRDGVTGITSEQQRVIITGDPWAGTYSLTFDTEESGAIAYDAATDVIASTIEALPSIGTGNVIITGDSTDYTIEFDSSLGDVGTGTADASNLSGSIGKTGTLDLNVTGIVELLQGASTVQTKMEIVRFTTTGSVSDTVYQENCTVRQDVIPDTPPSQTPLPTYAAASHTHTASQITDFEAAVTANVTVAANSAALTALPDTVITVKTAADLSGTLLSDVVYVIDGSINMGAQTITVPSGGLALRGAGSITDALTSTEAAYTMFVDAAADAGTLVHSGIVFMVSGAGSKVYDLESGGTTDVFSVDKCGYFGCTEIGTIKNYGVILINSTQDNTCADGWTFDGTAALMNVISCASTNMTSGGTVFSSGGTFDVTNNCIIDSGTFNIDAGVTFCDFVAANFTQDAGFNVTNNAITGAGTFFSNLDGGNAKCRWQENNFDPAANESNTYVGSSWEMTAEAITTVTVAATDYKAAGVTTYANQFWFSNTTSNAFVYDSARQINVEIKGAISITGTNGHTIQLKVRKWDDSLASYSDIQTVPGRTISSTGAAASVSILAYTTIDSPDDRIELWGQNVAATGDFIVKDNSVFSIIERSH